MKTTTKKLDQLFKIEGVGLDTTNLNYIPESNHLNNINYIHTSTKVNNDCMLSELFTEDGIESNPIKNNKIVVTEIDCVDSMNKVILSHINALGRDWLDILEIPADCNWTEDTVEQLKELLDAGIIYEISIKNPKNVERLIEIMDLLKTIDLVINYVSIDICPLNFNLNIINWCNENNIKIFGYNPIGGYINSPNLIQSFTVPYLLGFAATYCNVVFLSSRDMHKSIQGAKYLKSLFGEFTESIYVLKKSVFKLQKPLKKVVRTSAIYDSGTYIPYDTPENVPVDGENIIITLGDDYEEIPDDGVRESTELEKEIDNFIGQLSYPFDASIETKFSMIKNQIIGYLKMKKPDHDFTYSLINNTSIAVMARKETVSGWFKKVVTTDQSSYIISMKKNGLIYFRECSE